MSAMPGIEQDAGRGLIDKKVKNRRASSIYNRASAIYDDRSAAGSHKIAIASTSSKITKHSRMYKNV
jgi:hypothetical protein